MRELSKTLGALIDIASHVVTRHGLTLAGNIVSGQFAEVAAEVRAADARPSEGIRCTNAALAMVIALEAYRDGDRDPGSPWLMIAGALLPILRADAWRALNDEKEARR
ncbi:hypothetical protein [Bradyrhizobium retamae]|uniref:Uncharacterized protein n=1 Tax=Bradyrhizobium retamae TaxID=1300035 RepID=A0A0R3N7J6_9BRAD|nr:hypothetical protein [Bradyrhizobium retamae]KRR25941.1 hypothetical protein CQ13_23240 [Bradyrhizobium retamae]